MSWRFPPNDGGPHQGINDAGVQTFTGDTARFLAREALQNAIDARRNLQYPVEASFDLLEMPPNEIPGKAELIKTFAACEKFWVGNPQAKAFFNAAQRILHRKTVPVLKISDAKTTGVTGTDDDLEGNWYNLVRSRGASAKNSGEGGSFGIGKNAPFAASALRVVYYSTCNKDQEHVFQGVANLVTHRKDSGQTLQATGFYGMKDGKSIRNDAKIPAKFRRKSLGTDIYVVGYQDEGHWQHNLIESVLQYFWPAIHEQDLVVKVGDRLIDKFALPKLMSEWEASDTFTAPFYYRARTDAEAVKIEHTLSHLGPVELWLTRGDETFPNQIALSRKTGMIIDFRRTRGVIFRFSGFFRCMNEKGNELLRSMEPPAHNLWDPDRPEKGSGTKALTELYTWLRQCVGELQPVSQETVIDIPDLQKYLPDDADGVEEDFDEGAQPGKKSEKESVHETPKVTDIVAKKMRFKETTPAKDPDQDGTGGSGEKERGTGAKGGTHKGAGDAKGKTGGESSNEPLPIRFRSFPTDPAARIYRVRGTPTEDSDDMALTVEAVGDDSRSEPIEIAAAKLLPALTPLKIAAPNRILGLKASAGEEIQLAVTLADDRHCALKVAAYEV